jgi:hypothetical protein
MALRSATDRVSLIVVWQRKEMRFLVSCIQGLQILISDILQDSSG